MAYAATKKRAKPYTKIVEELPTMRRETVQLMRQAVSADAAPMLPLTVQALAEMLRD